MGHLCAFGDHVFVCYIVTVRILCVICRMTDSAAVKPDDWDEDAPEEIPDEEALMPTGWLVDEPAEVDDTGVLFRPLLAANGCGNHAAHRILSPNMHHSAIHWCVTHRTPRLYAT